MLEVLFVELSHYLKTLFARRSAKKSRSLVKLLCTKAKMESLDVEADFSGTTITRYNNILQLSPDRTKVVCRLNQGVYAGEERSNAQRLTLVEAFHIPLHHTLFMEQLMQNKMNWPQGVEYSCSQDNDWIIHISMYVDIDYDKNPFEDLEGYFGYASELQREIHLKYNKFRETHKSFFD